MKKDNNKQTIETYSFLNGKLISHNKEERILEWALEENDSQNLGINFINNMYIEVNEIQDKDDEYKKIIKFLKKYMEYYSKKSGQPIEDLNLKFINYGKTELVYVLTDKNKNRITLLVKQPKVKLGEVYEEMQNLIELKRKDNFIVAPIDYFNIGDQELYVTPYINQARCIASYNTWGMYIPEPNYRFENFNKEQERIVNTCMIAKLVSLYDFEKKEGISKCKLGGGDFMLLKGWELKIPSIENTLNQLYLIAARKKVKCSFEDYLELIREEFSHSTITEDETNLVINIRGRVPIDKKTIEDGINLGKQLLNYPNDNILIKEKKIES